jgi:hypothetical protein
MWNIYFLIKLSVEWLWCRIDRQTEKLQLEAARIVTGHSRKKTTTFLHSKPQAQPGLSFKLNQNKS